MTYPPQGQPGDPYGQPPQYSQPPADGYAPGQAGAGYGQQPPQYAQPDMGQGGYAPPGPGYVTQPGYAPQPGPGDQYGPYGPPPVQPTSKGGAGTAVLIVVVLILMIGGGAAGYLLLGGDDDEATTTAGDDTSETAEEDPDEDGEPTDDGGDGGEAPLPDDGLTVSSLGSVTPLPGDPWEFYDGPGFAGRLSSDSHAYYIPHTSSWISYLEVGMVDASYFPYDPADLPGSASAAMEAWTAGFAFGSTEGLQVGETTLTDTEVDGRPAVLAETTVSWTSSTSTTDLYEDIAILLVDVDGANGFFGMASVPESGTDARQAGIDALLGTVFGGESA
ncbi:MAG TPA: hypothetical protein VFU12_11945 [Glycomyces sp.]|nr:hypothetical protein [Glycomyces sp.]